MLIILVGLVAGLVEVFVVGDNNLAGILVVISFLMSLTALSIRREVSDQIAEQWELPRLIEQISNEHWQSEARQELQRLKLELQRWATGVRSVLREESIAFQIDLLSRSVKESCNKYSGYSRCHAYGVVISLGQGSWCFFPIYRNSPRTFADDI